MKRRNTTILAGTLLATAAMFGPAFAEEHDPTTPTSRDDCKKGGWQDHVDDEGEAFRNQGQCIKWVNQNT